MTLLITDNTVIRPQGGILPRPRHLAYGSKAAVKAGMVPFGDYPTKLIPEDEWKERILEAHEKRMMPIHRFEANNVEGKNQASTNLCWSYGVTSALEDIGLHQNQPYRRLAPASLNWLTGWKNRGFYLSETIRGAAERGICSSEFAPDGVYHYRDFKDGWQADALKHQPREWFDTDGSERQMVGMCVSLLLDTIPGYIAYNWWGHALMLAAVEWAEGELYNLRWVGWNSHNDGRIELVDHRGVPDEAYFLRSRN